MVLKIKVEFNIGDLVYLLIDNKKESRVITGYLINEHKHTKYQVASLNDFNYYYGFELLKIEHKEVRIGFSTK